MKTVFNGKLLVLVTALLTSCYTNEVQPFVKEWVVDGSERVVSFQNKYGNAVTLNIAYTREVVDDMVKRSERIKVVYDGGTPFWFFAISTYAEENALDFSLLTSLESKNANQNIYSKAQLLCKANDEDSVSEASNAEAELLDEVTLNGKVYEKVLKLNVVSSITNAAAICDSFFKEVYYSKKHGLVAFTTGYNESCSKATTTWYLQ